MLDQPRSVMARIVDQLTGPRRNYASSVEICKRQAREPYRQAARQDRVSKFAWLAHRHAEHHPRQTGCRQRKASSREACLLEERELAGDFMHFGARRIAIHLNAIRQRMFVGSLAQSAGQPTRPSPRPIPQAMTASRMASGKCRLYARPAQMSVPPQFRNSAGTIGPSPPK